MENTPQTIKNYFAAKNAREYSPFIACFTLDAKVEDESKTHTGPDEIWAWAKQTAKQYNEVSTITSYKEENGKSIVSANVAGTFDGSPIELTYIFELRDGLISHLSIG
jgi:hypothetical protein